MSNLQLTGTKINDKKLNFSHVQVLALHTQLAISFITHFLTASLPVSYAYVCGCA